MTEFAEPKCPECGKSRFSYKVVVSMKILDNTKHHIDAIKKGLETTKTKNDEAALKLHQKKYQEMLENRSTGNGMIFFCLHCGHIIGTGGKANDP